MNNIEQYKDFFTNDLKCFEYLAGIKWRDKFVCRHCGHTNANEGKKPYSKRCSRCKHEESVTVNTIFHNCKFPIRKAMYIIYSVLEEEAKVAIPELSRKLELGQISCWKFRHKVMTALERLQNNRQGEQISLEDIIFEKRTPLF